MRKILVPDTKGNQRLADFHQWIHTSRWVNNDYEESGLFAIVEYPDGQIDLFPFWEVRFLKV